MTTILHLKSGIAYIGDNTLVVMEKMAAMPQFRRVRSGPCLGGGEHAANCVRVNDRVLAAEWLSRADRKTAAHEVFDRLVLDMSEFQKMDGGLSCLSLRF